MPSFFLWGAGCVPQHKETFRCWCGQMVAVPGCSTSQGRVPVTSRTIVFGDLSDSEFFFWFFQR